MRIKVYGNETYLLLADIIGFDDLSEDETKTIIRQAWRDFNDTRSDIKFGKYLENNYFCEEVEVIKEDILEISV